MANPFAVSTEGVMALKALSQALPEQIGNIRQAGLAVLECQNSQAGGLGPHSASISSVLESVNEEAVQATAPVMELKEKVDRVAAAYQAVIDNNRYGGN